MEVALIYALWLREVKRFFRMKSRLIGSLAMPVFFLIFLGFAPIRLPDAGDGGYMSFLAPGIIGMILLFASMGAGISVLWDKQFGFLKEIMVAPVSRHTIVLGKTLGGVTTALFQAIFILILALPLGLELTGIDAQPSFAGYSLGFLLAVVFMILIGLTFTGLGVAFASRMKDFQGFQFVWNFLVMPVFLTSGALFPLEVFPQWLQYLTYINPLTYGVDGLRGSLIATSNLPVSLNLAVLLGTSIITIALAAYLFTRTEVD